MQHKRVIRAGAAGALGISLCFCNTALASSATKLAKPYDSAVLAANLDLTGLAYEALDISPVLNPKLPTLAGDDTPKITPWKQIKVKKGDTLSGVFSRAGLDSSQWQHLLRLGHSTQALRHLHAGDTLDIRKTPSGELAELRYQVSSLETLHINRHGSGFQARTHKQPTSEREITARGDIHRSLAHSMAATGIPASIAKQVIKVFKQRHDLNKLENGDEFAVVYNATYSKGRLVSVGTLQAASITTDQHQYQAFRAKDQKGRYTYFDADGKAYDTSQSFLRNPVAYTRISSPFNLHRINPVTRQVRPHKGVDLAAPIGTPVRATAAGTVKFSGWMSGYGRVIELDNPDGYSSRYAHLNRIHRTVRQGTRVSKGQVIGYVGQTGRATGPHLHYELRYKGMARNPMTTKLPTGHKLPDSQIAAYKHKIQPLLAKLSPTPLSILAHNYDQDTQASNDYCARNSSHQTNNKRHNKAINILCIAKQRAGRA